MTEGTTVETAPILFTELAMILVRKKGSMETMTGKIRADIMEAMPAGYHGPFVHIVDCEEGEFFCAWSDGDIMVDCVEWSEVELDKGPFAGKTAMIPHPLSDGVPGLGKLIREEDDGGGW